MTNEEFCKAHIGERVLFKGKDIGAYVAGQGILIRNISS